MDINMCSVSPLVANDATNCNIRELDKVLNWLPLGYKFLPDDTDLVKYLKAKINGDFIISGRIHDIDIYQHSPQELSEKYKREGEEHTYFFTPRNRKYLKGSRPNRAVQNVGFWKATGRDNPVSMNNVIIGFKKTLVFYEGKPKAAEKTNWIMQEYTYNQDKNLQISNAAFPTWKLDDWVLCKIYKNKREREGESRDNVDKRNEHKRKIDDTKEVATTSREESSSTTSKEEESSKQHIPNQYPRDESQHQLTQVSSSSPIFDSRWDTYFQWPPLSPSLMLSLDDEDILKLIDFEELKTNPL